MTPVETADPDLEDAQRALRAANAETDRYRSAMVKCCQILQAACRGEVTDDRNRRLWVICPDPYCRECKDETGEIRMGWDDAPAGESHRP